MLSRLAKAVTIGPLPYWASLTQWRQGGLGGFGRHAQRGALLAYVEGRDWPSGGGIGDNG